MCTRNQYARILGVVAVCLAFTVACVTKSPYEDEQWFQALGEPGEIVVTMDVSKPSRILDSGMESTGEDSLGALMAKRADRVTVAFQDPSPDDEGGDAKPLSSYSMRGGVEGDFPRFVTNTALLWTPGWTLVENEETHWYRNEQLDINVAVPRTGLLLFSNDDYMSLWRDTYAHRTTRINTDAAKRMADAIFGVYVASPRTMLDIGLAIPATVLLQTESMLLVVAQSEDTGTLQLHGSVSMVSDKIANTLSILLKTSYIAEKRRAKAPLGNLAGLFVLDGNTVHIHAMDLSDEQVAALSKMFGSLIVATGG